MKELAATVACVLLAFAGLFYGINAAIGTSCRAEWKDSGFPARYSFWSDCQIFVGGRWLPAKNYREIPTQ